MKYGDGRDNRAWMVFLRCVRSVCPPEVVASRYPYETGWHTVTAELVRGERR